jgi:flagellin
VQGASDTNVSSDRTALNSEFNALKGEITRITKNTQWNGMNVLDGSANSSTGSFNFQVGASAGQTVNQTIGNMGMATVTGGTYLNANTPATSGAAQKDAITIAGTPAAGDVVTVTMGKAQFQYTVTATDVAGAQSAAANFQSIGASMATAMAATNGSQPSFLAANGLASAASALGVLTLTGATNNVTYSAPTIATSNGGSLANVNDLSVSSQVTATGAIASMDSAIATVNSTRSGLGATINRLTYAADNLANVSQNAQASRSRIQDTDYAKTSTELARTQIIAQAATAMLAQANQSQQSVLALLK